MRALRSWVGVAGIAYAVLAGLENLDFLAVPGPRASPEVVSAYYATGGLPLAGWLGGLALGAYLVFFAGLASLLAPHRRTSWAGLVMLGGAVAGPALAAAGLAARAVAVSGAVRDPGLIAAMHGVYLDARAVAGVFMGLTLVGAAIATRNVPEPVLPRWWRMGALAIGGWLVLASGAAVTTAPVAGALALAGFVADAAWIALAGAYLCLPRGVRPGPELAAWLMFLAVALAAGASGLLLLALPDQTASFFSWPLDPPPLAAVVGASYLAAAVAYGAGLARGGPLRTWGYARGLLVGIVALSVPVLLFTLGNLAVFDFGRWQAWAWVGLFGLFPAAALSVLWWGRGRAEPGSGRPGPLVVGLVAAYVGLMLMGTLVLWERPDLASQLAPVSGFGGQVLGGWLLLAATAAVVTAGRYTPIGLLVPALPIAWLQAGFRFPGQLADHPAWLLFCAVSAVLGGLVAVTSWRSQVRVPQLSPSA